MTLILNFFIEIKKNEVTSETTTFIQTLFKYIFSYTKKNMSGYFSFTKISRDCFKFNCRVQSIPFHCIQNKIKVAPLSWNKSICLSLTKNKAVFFFVLQFWFTRFTSKNVNIHLYFNMHIFQLPPFFGRGHCHGNRASKEWQILCKNWAQFFSYLELPLVNIF